MAGSIRRLLMQRCEPQFATFGVSDRVAAQANLRLSIKTAAVHMFSVSKCGSLADNADESRPQDVEIELLGVIDYDRYFLGAPAGDA